MSRLGVQRCAETPHGCHLHPVRRAVEGGSEASGVFGSRWRRLPTLHHAAPAPTVFAASVPVVEHIPALAVSAAPASVVEYISTAPAASYAAPAPAVFPAPVLVVEYMSPALTGYAAPVKYIASHRQCTQHLLSTSHQQRRELQRIHRCTRASSSLAFTLRFERHAGVHFHARVSTLASSCVWAAVPPMSADRCVEQEPRTTLRTT